MDPLWISILVGLGVGISLSVGLGVRNIFGISSANFITYTLVAALSATGIVLSTLSVMVRDLSFPRSFPGLFTVETLLMAFVPASVFFVMAVFRGYAINTLIVGEFLAIAAKFGILHILLQFSGFYSSIFPFKQLRS